MHLCVYIYIYIYIYISIVYRALWVSVSLCILLLVLLFNQHFYVWGDQSKSLRTCCIHACTYMCVCTVCVYIYIYIYIYIIYMRRDRITTSGVHYFSNNSTDRSQLFRLYYGCHTSRHRSDDIFQDILPVFLLKSLLWVGLYLLHLIRC